VPAPGDDRIFAYPVQIKEHFNVGEVGESLQRVGSEAVFVEANLGDNIALVVFS
jgi:hypothetical protein